MKCWTKTHILTKINKMVVPVIEVNGVQKEILASAFIIDQGLIITAAHTFFDEKGNKKSTQFKIKVGESFYHLGKPIYEEYQQLGQKYAKTDFIYKDLSIFHLPINIEYNSELTLSTNYDYNSPVSLVGTPDSDSVVKTISGFIQNQKESATNIEPGGSNMRYFNNCFRINKSVDDGFSGGPVIMGNQVYGMIVFGSPEKGTTAIKSEYILEKIREFKYDND
jgi:hypothetical protein